MVPGSLAEWEISLPNLTAKLGGGVFSTSLFYLSSGIAGEQGPRGLPGVPGSVGPRGMSERPPQACREGPHSEEEVLGSPRVLLGSPRFVQDGHKVFFQKKLLSVKTLGYDSDFIVGLGAHFCFCSVATLSGV